MHGGILSGFLSHFVGMHFPGKRSLLLSSDLRFVKPSYVGETIALEATVSRKVESEHALVLNVRFFNKNQNTMVAQGRVQVKIRDE